MNTNLKPCPFCGSKDIRHRNCKDQCENCGASVEFLELCDCYGEDDRPNWNTRPIEDALQKRIAELESQIKGNGVNAYLCKCGHVWLSVDELLAQCCPSCGEVIVYSISEIRDSLLKAQEEK